MPFYIRGLEHLDFDIFRGLESNLLVDTKGHLHILRLCNRIIFKSAQPLGMFS